MLNTETIWLRWCRTSVSVFAGLTLSAASFAATVIMPGANGSIALDNAQFASSVLDFKLGASSFVFSPNVAVHGPFNNATQFGSAVLGSDLVQGLTVDGAAQDFVTLGFAKGGATIYFWEAGNLTDIADTHVLASIDGGHSFSSVVHVAPLLHVTHPLDKSSSFNTNVAILHAADFGLPADASINAIRISSASLDHADVLAVAAIPEPGSVSAVAAGLFVLTAVRAWKRRSAI